MEKCKLNKMKINILKKLSDEMLPDNFLYSKENMIRLEFPQIGRTQLSDLYTIMTRKDYRACFEKGRIRPNMETLPFGHGNILSQNEEQINVCIKIIF